MDLRGGLAMATEMATVRIRRQRIRLHAMADALLVSNQGLFSVVELLLLVIDDCQPM